MLTSADPNTTSNTAEQNEKSDFYGIIVGVDYYLNTIRPLSGCVRDAEGYYSLAKDYLLKDQRIPESEISTYLTLLTSTTKFPGRRYRGAPPVETGKWDPAEPLPSDAKILATCENIIKALQTVTKKAKKGDRVLFTFSGHGSRDRSLLRTEQWAGKHPQFGMDEALVPCDASRMLAPGAELKGSLIRDFELNYLFRGLVDKGIKLTVLLDCCHSGGTMREEEEDNGLDILGIAAVRRARLIAQPSNGNEDTAGSRSQAMTMDFEDFSSYKTHSILAKDHLDEMKKAWEKLMDASTFSGLSGADTASPAYSKFLPLIPFGYTVMAAALQHELSREIFGNGVFTQAMTMALRSRPKASLRDTYRFIYDCAYQRYDGVDDATQQEIYSVQTPIALGILDRTLFDEPVPRNHFSDRGIPIQVVKDLDLPVGQRRKLVIRYGKAHGATLYSQFLVRLWNEVDENTPESDVRVILTKLGEVSSEVTEVYDASSSEEKRFAKIAAEEQKVWSEIKENAWLEFEERIKKYLAGGGDEKKVRTREQGIAEGDTLAKKNIFFPWPNGCQAFLLCGGEKDTEVVYHDLPGDLKIFQNWQLGGAGNAGILIPGPVPLRFITDPHDGQTQPEIHYRIVKNGPGYQLQDGATRALLLPYIYPPESVSTKLVRDIRQIALYRARKGILWPENDPTFRVESRSKVFYFKKLSEENPKPTPSEPETVTLELTWNKGAITRTGRPQTNLAIFYFSHLYGIRKIYPTDGAFESIECGDPRTISFVRKTPPIDPVTKTPVKETVKVMIFNSSSLSFGVWEMADIDGEGDGHEGDVASMRSKKIEVIKEMPTGVVVETKGVDVEMDEKYKQYGRWWTVSCEI